MELVLVDMKTITNDDLEVFSIDWLPKLNEDEHIMLVMLFSINSKSYKIIDCLLKCTAFNGDDFKSKWAQFNENELINIEHLTYEKNMSIQVAVFLTRLKSVLTHKPLIAMIHELPKKVRGKILPYILE